MISSVIALPSQTQNPAVQTDCRHVEQNVHCHDQPAGDQCCHEIVQFQLPRDLRSIDRQAAPHQASEERKLIWLKSNADIEVRAVVVDVRDPHRQQLQGKSGNGSGDEQPQFLAVLFPDDIPKEHRGDGIAQQFKCVDPVHPASVTSGFWAT